MIDLKEVFVANGLTLLAAWFLLDCRRKNRESAEPGDRLFDAMCIVDFLGALFETAAFVVDDMDFMGARQINYLSNSLAFLGTVSIGFIWSLYTDLRVYRDPDATRRRAKLLCIPWVIEVAAIVYNLLGTGLLFSISQENVYERGPGAIIGYISLMVYFAYSVAMVLRSRNQGINLRFFPIQYFVGPCIVGVVAQFFFYGITTSWVSVATALVFVQMQTYAEDIYIDELSGLFNRRYLDRMIKNGSATHGDSLWGIMLDINDFKEINDKFGHGVGDRAIRILGDVLYRTAPTGSMAIRYAGDEFIILMPDCEQQLAQLTMDEINRALAKLNDSGDEPFRLHAAMGCAHFGADDDPETFLHNMDEKMYEDKRRFHQSQA